MTDLLTPDALIAFATLAGMEIVLGIDNIVFIAILTGKLPEGQRLRAQRIGIGGAMVLRVGLLLGISWIMGLTAPLVSALGRSLTGRDLILLGGGLFLIGKATYELHQKVEGDPQHETEARAGSSFVKVVLQILLVDMVFSLDSVITAVGMVKDVRIMVAAILASVAVMLVFAAPVSAFVERHPTIKVLALAFLLLIGVMLTTEGMGTHVEKAYIYFAMAFSLAVELVNLRLRAKEARRAAGPPAPG